VRLFDPSRLLDQSLEDASHRRRVERFGRVLRKVFEHVPFASRIVNGHLPRALHFADAKDESDALRDEAQNVSIDRIDLGSQLL
jgi:hypothetical protein